MSSLIPPKKHIHVQNKWCKVNHWWCKCMRFGLRHFQWWFTFGTTSVISSVRLGTDDEQLHHYHFFVLTLLPQNKNVKKWQKPKSIYTSFVRQWESASSIRRVEWCFSRLLSICWSRRINALTLSGRTTLLWKRTLFWKWDTDSWAVTPK